VFAELHTKSHYSFLRGASSPEELVYQASELGYSALAITDECSYAGIVKAYQASKECNIKLIIGSEFSIEASTTSLSIILLAPSHRAYTEISKLITMARCRSPKGEYSLSIGDLQFGLQHCLAIWLPSSDQNDLVHGQQLKRFFKHRLWIGVELFLLSNDQERYLHCESLSRNLDLPMVACNDVHMHHKTRKPLQDTLTAIRLNTTVQKLSKSRQINAERYLKPLVMLRHQYPIELLNESIRIADLCTFSMSHLRYEYPRETVPAGLTPSLHLRALTEEGIKFRWPSGISHRMRKQVDYELNVIEELEYEYYFLTVHDIVRFARSQNILCQGRGSAANSAVCYCLFITEIDPNLHQLLFERFISKERNEPPDIDVDFESQRREEVIQYIYEKYSRKRTALTATVITYRRKSAIRDVGKALGLPLNFIEELNRSMAWWDKVDTLTEQMKKRKLSTDNSLSIHFVKLVKEILGTPRHLSQHVGGFLITHSPTSTLVPIENAAMPNRTIIQWDKDDLEELGLLKVDVLALGMLTAINKCFNLIADFRNIQYTMANIPADDTPTYDMICKADTIGVFQIESRAQMSMLPRLRPRNYYDLVIEVAIVRPGPIQGGMVNPYLQRRQGTAPVTYPNKALERVLQRTLGVPVFQEQVMEIAMVAAGFSAGQADQLRRSMAAWRRVGAVTRFKDEVINGMLNNGYEQEFAEAIFKQIEGFGEYGFPESHAASFALLVYVSCYLKCHEPAAFVCAMLNSQPLGFYDPSDLTQDARRHGVTILPLDINISEYDHQLVPDPTPSKHGEPAVRLGFRLVARLSETGAEQVLAARQHGPFISAADLVRRSGINKTDQQALAIAGALEHISGDRHQAQWDLLGVEQLPELLEQASAYEPQLALPEPTEGENIVADYLSMGLTLGRHPLSLLRQKLTQRRIIDSASWSVIPNGRTARLAGIIKVRQRPGSAKGVMFLTIEDENGPVNVIVWEHIVELFRQEVLRAKMVSVYGVTQREQGVVHLVARKIEDLSWMLGEISTHSRNFH